MPLHYIAMLQHAHTATNVDSRIAVGILGAMQGGIAPPLFEDDVSLAGEVPPVVVATSRSRPPTFDSAVFVVPGCLQVRWGPCLALNEDLAAGLALGCAS